MHHALVAAGSALARSVCVIQPYSPFAGVCLRGEDAVRLRADFLGEGRFADRGAFFLCMRTG